MTYRRNARRRAIQRGTFPRPPAVDVDGARRHAVYWNVYEPARQRGRLVEAAHALRRRLDVRTARRAT